jgi:hypothetical protein
MPKFLNLLKPRFVSAFKDKRTVYFFISPQKGIVGNFVSDPLDWLVNTKFNLGQFLCINIAKENEIPNVTWDNFFA